MTSYFNFVVGRPVRFTSLKFALILTFAALSTIADATADATADTTAHATSIDPSNLEVMTQDSNESTSELSGRVGIQSLRVFPRSVSFYNTDVRGPYPSEFIRVTNWGRETVKNVRVNSAGCNLNFDVFDRCYFDLRSGQECSITIRHRPYHAGHHSCTISIMASGGSYDTVFINASAIERKRFDQE